jgi:OOP family OmpA-OmpF porin
MNKNTIAPALIAALMGVGTAQASEFDGPYIGAKAGVNVTDMSSVSSKTVFSGGGEAGYNWDVNNFLLGLSGFYDYNSKKTHTGTGVAPATVNYGSQVYGADLKLGIPNDKWMPYAKVGYARVTGNGDPYAAVIKDNAVHYGAGVEYKAMPNLGVALEWTGNSGKKNATKLNNNNFTLGLNYYFGNAPKPAPAPVAMVKEEPKPAPKPVYKTIFSDKPVTIEGANFDSGSAVLKPSAFPQLDKVVDFAARYPNAGLSITGYTDSRGAATLNQALSEQRAESVKAYLVGKGVAADRISTMGEGEANPVADNATAAGRAKNRRVEIRSVIREEQKVRVNP